MKTKIQLLTRLYTTLLGLGMTFYTLGIGLITPPTEPADLKWVFLTAAIIILLAMVVFVNAKKAEHFDDRAVQNLLKTSAVTLSIVMIAAIILFAGLLLSSRYIYMNSGILAIVIGVIFTSFAYAFFIFERQGK